ncbi:hypothetical protein YC2023_012894 [Brassica napus]
MAVKRMALTPWRKLRIWVLKRMMMWMGLAILLQQNLKYGVGDVPAEDDAAGDGGRRVSKRRHTSPKRFSPSELTVRKEATKKGTKIVPPTKQASKRAKQTANASSNPTPPTRVLPIFIGGFNAFAPPTQANRDAFLKRLTATKSVDDCSGSSYSISSLGPLFHCNGVCSHEALNRVVNLIRNRRDRLPSAKFEFVPPSFFLELMRNYAGFEAIKEKQKFAFSTHLKPQFLHLPGWYTQVDFIYSSFLIKKPTGLGSLWTSKCRLCMSWTLIPHAPIL